MLFLIFLAAALLSSLTSSATLPEKGHSIAARHNEMPGNMRCSTYYGRPDPADCDAVVESVKAFRIGASGDTMAFHGFVDDFIQRGADDQYPYCEATLQLPIYWRTGEYTLRCPSNQSLYGLHRSSCNPLMRSPGTCIGALFIDETVNGATADVENWLNIFEVAQDVNGMC